MKEKAFDPARHNEQSPSEGMAAVNTHNPEEKPIEETIAQQKNDAQKTRTQDNEKRSDENSKTAS